MSWKAGFAELTQKPHSKQAVWWLNGFWKTGMEKEAEAIWTITHRFIEIDQGRPVHYGKKVAEVKENCDLDELKSHRVLELLGETMTVQALRKHLKELDLDNNKRLSLTEYLLDKYKKTPAEVVNSPQGQVDQKALDAAEAKMNEASNSLNTAIENAEAAAKALIEATSSAEKAKKALEEQKIAEEAVRKAEAEVQAAVDDVKKQEDEIQHKIEALEKIANDEGKGAVQKNKAKNEIAQIKSEDPMPLRKAKITLTAALGKVGKERKKAEERTAAAAADQAAAEKAYKDSEAAKAAAEEGKKAAVEAFAAAERALEEVKKKGDGIAEGAIFWMDRTLKEKKKFMPK